MSFQSMAEGAEGEDPHGCGLWCWQQLGAICNANSIVQPSQCTLKYHVLTEENERLNIFKQWF